VTALLVQGLMTLALVIFGAFQISGLKAMVYYTSPVFWLFFLLTGVSLIVLRYRDPAAQRPFRVPLFPVTPLIFCAVCAYMLYSSIMNFGRGALVGVAVLALGTPLMLAARRRDSRARGFEPVLPPAAPAAATDQS
jgi:amino acid transporter